jgi:hypothetical protein
MAQKTKRKLLHQAEALATVANRHRPETPLEQYKAAIGNRPLDRRDIAPLLAHGIIGETSPAQQEEWIHFENFVEEPMTGNSAYDGARHQVLSDLRIAIVKAHIAGQDAAAIATSLTTPVDDYNGIPSLQPSPRYVESVLESWKEHQARVRRKP